MKDSVVEVEVAGPRKVKVTRGRRGEGLRSTNPETNLATTLLNPGDVQDLDLHPLSRLRSKTSRRSQELQQRTAPPCRRSRSESSDEVDDDEDEEQ